MFLDKKIPDNYKQFSENLIPVFDQIKSLCKEFDIEDETKFELIFRDGRITMLTFFPFDLADNDRGI